MKKYITGIPRNYNISLAINSESNDAAEEYLLDIIKKYDLLVMAIDENGNYIEVGDLRIVRNEWADRLNLDYEESSDTPRPGQKFTDCYELCPADNRNSFYGKAFVKTDTIGNQILYSYSTPVVMKDRSGKIHRLWSGWSQTTGRHIRAFCGLYKSDLDKLETEEL